MAKCQFIKRRHRKLCIGDLNTLIKLQSRSITEPLFGGTDFDEDFVDTGEVWAKVETVSGKTIFDGVGSDIVVTHMITIRFDSSVSNETWIELDGKRIDILNFEDWEERHEFLLLLCTNRGVGEASKA